MKIVQIKRQGEVYYAIQKGWVFKKYADVSIDCDDWRTLNYQSAPYVLHSNLSSCILKYKYILAYGGFEVSDLDMTKLEKTMEEI